MNGITQELVDFSVKTTFDDLPGEVVRKTKLVLLDSIGCALGGGITERARIVSELVAELGGASQATIIGNGMSSWTLAAFANGELIDALDYDASGPLQGHVVPYVIAPSLAMGERVKASGTELITALAVALELGGRVGSALAQQEVKTDKPPYFEYAKTYSFATTIFGAIAGAGKLLKLDAAGMANAFGIAGVSTPLPGHLKWTLTGGPGVMTKYHCWAGWVAQLATTAVLAAEKGFCGDTTVLDREWGFWKMYGPPYFTADVPGAMWGVGLNTDEEISNKFRSNASFSGLRSDQVEEVIETVLALEKVDNMTQLTKSLLADVEDWTDWTV